MITNDTISGLWLAVDEQWKGEIDTFLFNLISDAYRDAGDEAAAEAVQWAISWNRVPSTGSKVSWFFAVDYEWNLENWNWLPTKWKRSKEKYNWLFSWHKTASAAYLQLIELFSTKSSPDSWYRKVKVAV